MTDLEPGRVGSDGATTLRAGSVPELLGAASVFASVLSARIEEVLATISGDHALTLPQLRFLIHLEQDQGATLTDVATGLEISSSMASRSVDRLVERGFLRRRQGVEDRRTVRLAITDEGRSLLDTYWRAIHRGIESPLGGETPERLEAMTGALDRMTRALLEARDGVTLGYHGCLACNLFRRDACPLGDGRPHAACHDDAA